MLFRSDLDLVAVDQGGAAGLAVLLGRRPQLVREDLLHPPGGVENVLQVLNFLLERGGLLDPLQDVLLVCPVISTSPEATPSSSSPQLRFSTV